MPLDPPGSATPAAPPILTRRHYGWLTLLFLVLVVYGSLVPFHCEFVPFDEAAACYCAGTAAG